MADLWFRAFPKLRIVLTVRHPIDVCNSWMGRKWGERWGKDSLSFWPVPEVNGEPVPWFAMDFAQEFARNNPMSRIVKCVLALNHMNEETLKKLNGPQCHQVKTVCFEKMATEPIRELKKIATWLDTTLHPEIQVYMVKLRTPRKLDLEDRRAKLENIKRDIEPDLLDQLLEASRTYENEWGLDSV